MRTCVFISYSSKDRNVARTVREQLAGADFSVWRDEEQLEGDWSQEIAQSLAEQADILCLLWTHSAASSHWVKHEWLTARALEKCIIPCLFASGPDLPLPLSTLHGIRFDDVQSGSNSLVERLRGLKSFRVKYEFKILPKNSFIPFNPNPEFVGRNRDLVDLYLKMIGNLCHIGLNQVGTIGMGGVGKTQLAVEFAYRYSFAFDNIFWIDATDPQAWLRHFVSLARDRLQLVIPDPQAPESTQQYLFKLQEHFKRHPGTLLVLDNIGDPNLLNSEKPLLGTGLTPLSLGANLLFTTRRSFNIPGVSSHSVDVLSADTAYDLLTTHRIPLSNEEKDHARAIANAVGYLPLAIVLIAGYMRKLRSVTFSDYRAALLARKLASIDVGLVTSEELATRHEVAVGATLETQWQAIQRDDQKLILKLAAILPESAIVPKARLGLLGAIPPGRSPIDRPLDSVFLALEEFHLAELMGDGSHIRLHPLVREFVSHLIPVAYLDAFKQTATKSLAAAYQDPFRLDSELRARGVEEVIGDLRVARSFCDDPQFLPDLERLLNRERHLLSNATRSAPRSVLQQLHHRAQLMALPQLADSFFTAYRSIDDAALRVVAVRPSQDAALVRFLSGHSNKITGAAFLDDSRVLTASWDSYLILWDLEFGQPLLRLTGHSGVINALAVAADGTLAYSASDDKTVVVWNMSTGERIETLYGHEDYVMSVAASADGRYVASVARDGRLICWDTARGTKVEIECGPSGRYFGNPVAIRSDGSLLLCTLRVSAHTEQSKLLFIDPNGVIERIVPAHEGEVFAIASAFEGGKALTAGYDGKLILWDTDTASKVSVTETNNLAFNVAFGRDIRHVITDSGSNLVLWDVQTGSPLRTFRGHSGIPDSVALSPNGKRAISTEWQTIIEWDVTTPEAPADSEVHQVGLVALGFAKDATSIASLDESGNILAWDVRQTTAVRQCVVERRSECSLRWDDKCLLAGIGTEAFLQNLETGAILRQFALPEELNALTLSSDTRVAYFAVKHSMLAVDIHSGKRVPAPSFRGVVHSLSSLADPHRLVIGSDYGLLIVWDLSHDRELLRCHGAQTSVSAMGVDSAGHIAATATWDSHEVIVWNLATGRALYRLQASNRVTAIALKIPHLVFGDASGHMHFLRMEGIGSIVNCG